MKNDARLARLKDALPAGWTITMGKGSTMALERTERAWVLFENRINAPVSRESPQERSERIRRRGRSVACRFVFRCEHRWSAEKARAAREKNAALDREIAGLPAKHGIARLRDAGLSRKGEDLYTPTNSDEEKGIASWRRERDELRAKRKPLPDFSSERASLFLESREGMEDDLRIVDPPAASEEMMAIERSMLELLPVD